MFFKCFFYTGVFFISLVFIAIIVEFGNGVRFGSVVGMVLSGQGIAPPSMLAAGNYQNLGINQTYY